MKYAVFITIFLLSANIHVQAQSIRKLDDRTAFETAVKSNENVVIIFAAEWCDYCKAFLPKVGSIVEDYEGVKFFRINYDENIALFQAEGIEATPTVKLYKNGTKMDEIVTIEVEPLQEKLRGF